MYRNRENRLFGKPASIVSEEERKSEGFVITLNPEDLKKKDVNEMTSNSIEVKLLQFANSQYAKELAEKNDADTFIQYCLDNIYHLSMDDIINKSSKIVDDSFKVNFDVLVYTEAIFGAGLVALAEIGALVISLIAGDEPGEEPGPANIASAAAICGGKAFKDCVVKRYCALMQETENKRWELVNA